MTSVAQTTRPAKWLARLLALLGALAVATALAAHAEASIKGSSCAHPYKVHYLNPEVDDHGKFEGEQGTFAGDKSLIRAHIGGESNSRNPNTGSLLLSWKSLQKRLKLKVCTTRITFNFHKPIVSHRWHPIPVRVAYTNPGFDRVESFVVSAARSTISASRARRERGTATSRGSSCAHPYRVFMVTAQHRDRGLRNDGEFVGDTSLIKAKWGPSVLNLHTNLYHVPFRWTPRAAGLKLCQARIEFKHRKRLVSHKWHKKPVVIILPSDGSDAVTAFVVTASR